MLFRINTFFILLLFCNNTFAQDKIDWKNLESTFSKILTTEDFRLTHQQKEERVSNSNYELKMATPFFKKEKWEYRFDDFFQTDYLIYEVKMFEGSLKKENEGNENYGMIQLEKIIDQILGKDYIKFKNAEIIGLENRRDDNVDELIEEFEGTGTLIQWMHFTDVGKDDFVPLKKSVRIFYDYYFDVLTIEFNGVDGFVEIPKEGNLSTTGITLGEFSRLYFETKETDKKHPPHIITIQEISNKEITFEWQSHSVDTEGIISMPRKTLDEANQFSFDFVKEKTTLYEQTVVWLSNKLYQDLKKEKEVRLDLGNGSMITFSKYRKGTFSFSDLKKNIYRAPVWIASSKNGAEELWILDDPQQPIVVKMKNGNEFYLSRIGL